MKYTGRYDSIECDYDLDHEINEQTDRVKNIIKDIDFDNCQDNRKAILKAMAETIINEI